MENKCKVLLVPDWKFWVTGMIAKQIASQESVDAIICSEPVLNELFSEFGHEFPLDLDVVHFLTPHIATRQFQNFADRAACVATVHHVEDENSVEPVEYVDAVCTVCDQWHNHIVDTVSDPAKVVQIKNGLDTRLFRPAPNESTRRRIRTTYEIAEDRFVIGFSAKRTSDTLNRKGLQVVAALMEQSASRNDPTTWIVRGPGWQPFVDRFRARSVDIRYLPFLPTQREVAESYQMMDAFVVAARIEGGPYPLIEAMSSGLACVTTPVGLAMEVVDDGKSGFVVPFDDIEAFYDRLTRIRCLPDLRIRMAAEGRRAIAQKLRWDRSLAKIPALYEIARRNYRLRSEISTESTISVRRDRNNCRQRLNRWIKAREYAAFSEFLESEQCADSSRYFANRAIKHAPLDPQILSRCFSRSSFGQYYKSLCRVRSSVIPV
jgi:glycosyltransferase involved in cell wall biosynthesis